MRDTETSGIWTSGILDKKCQRRKGARVKLGIREGEGGGRADGRTEVVKP